MIKRIGFTGPLWRSACPLIRLRLVALIFDLGDSSSGPPDIVATALLAKYK